MFNNNVVIKCLKDFDFEDIFLMNVDFDLLIKY